MKIFLFHYLNLLQISQLNSFKNKSLFDLKAYKVKLENLIESFKSQIENITLTLTEFTIKNVSDCESRIKNELNAFFLWLWKFRKYKF